MVAAWQPASQMTKEASMTPPCKMDALYMLLPSPAGDAEHQREQQKNDRNPEEKLCTLHRGSGDAAKAEYASDKRDDQKNKRPMQKIAEIHSVTSQT